MKNQLVLKFAALLLICCAMLGCGKEEDSSNEGGKGSIYGTVTDFATGDPVRNANVQLRPSGETTLTGYDGMYEFLDISDGNYSITVSKAEYTDLIDDYVIEVKNGRRMRRDVQIEKQPVALRVVDSNGEDISSLGFGKEQDVTSRTFSIFNDSPQSLTWWIEENCNWIVEVKSMISNNQSGRLEAGKLEPIKVTIDRSKLETGLNSYYLNINSDNGSKELLVTAGEDVWLPSVTTQQVSNVTSNSVTFNGMIVEEGWPVYTERGFVYSTSAQPTLDNGNKIISEDNNQANFSATVLGLGSNVLYCVRAYAINEVGIAYGNDVVFSTNDVTTVLSTSAVTNITNNGAKLNGNITTEGVPAYTEKGFCYSKTNAPTISNNKVIVSGTGTGEYSYSINGLEYQTAYYVRAYAIQKGSPIYGNEVQFSTAWTDVQVNTSAATEIGAASAKLNGNIGNVGSPAYTERGFCYSKNGEPTISNNKIVDSGTGIGNYSYNISGLEYQTTYYVRAYAIQNGNPVYGNTVDFTTAWTEVQVNTSATTEITSNEAKFNGSIANAGSPAYTERGFCYDNWSSTPTISNNKIVVSGSGVTGNYNKKVSGLSSGTTYYVRAYAIQNGEVVYGGTVNFTTTELPVVHTLDITNLTPIYSGGIILSWNVTFNGYIEVAGSPAYVERGFCYDTYSNPTSNKIVVSGSGTGTFSKNVTNLSNYKTYYVRAYVKTSTGQYIYGQNVSFDTYDW